MFGSLAQLVPRDYTIISIARSWRPLTLDKTMIRCIGPGVGTESLDGDSRDEDWKEVSHAPDCCLRLVDRGFTG